MDAGAIVAGIAGTLTSALLLWIATTMLRMRDDVRSLVQEVRGMNGGGLTGRVDELEDWRLSMPDQLRQAKHDAVNEVTPAIMEVDLQSQKRDEAVEARLMRLIEVRR